MSVLSSKNLLAMRVLTMLLVLAWPMVFVPLNEKPVFWAVVACPKGLKRLLVCDGWPNKPPGVAPKPLVPTKN